MGDSDPVLQRYRRRLEAARCRAGSVSSDSLQSVLQAASERQRARLSAGPRLSAVVEWAAPADVERLWREEVAVAAEVEAATVEAFLVRRLQDAKFPLGEAVQRFARLFVAHFAARNAGKHRRGESSCSYLEATSRRGFWTRRRKLAATWAKEAAVEEIRVFCDKMRGVVMRALPDLKRITLKQKDEEEEELLALRQFGSKAGAEICMRAIQQVLFPLIHDCLFQLYREKNHIEDAEFEEHVKACSGIKTTELGISEKFSIDSQVALEFLSSWSVKNGAHLSIANLPGENPYKQSFRCIQEISSRVTPTAKLKTILATSRALCTCVDEFYSRLGAPKEFLKDLRM